MANIITRQANLGATLSEATSKLLYGGPCEVLGLIVDFAAAADAGTVLRLRDGSSTGLIKYTQTGNTDLGTTVPVRLHGDARLIAGTATAGVGLNLPFFDGVFAEVTLDVAGPQSVRIILRPLIKKSVGVVTVGADGAAVGSANIFSGPGRFKAARVDYGQDVPSTTNTQFRDGVAIGGRALTVATDVNTDWAAVDQSVVTTTGEDEAGAAVTTAATGAYANDGVLFYEGLFVNILEANADLTAQIDCLIEG